MDSRNGVVCVPSQVATSGLISFFDTFPKGVVVTNASHHIQYINNSAERLFGLSCSQVIGCSIRPLLTGILPKFSSSGGNPSTYQCSVIASDNKKIPVEVNYNEVDEAGSRLGFFMLDDISERIKNQQRLFQQSITDSLTGLFNRRYFDERLEQEFGRASRYRRLFSVIIIDIDGFKQANDLYGHGYGDQMLKLATEVFRETFRDDDTLYRYGGDEFAMILPETTKEGAVEVAERLRDYFSQRCCDKVKRIKLSLSIGVASHPEDGADSKDLIGVADRRMYIAKEGGGNRISAYDSLAENGSEVDQMLVSLTNLAQMMEKSRGFCSIDGIGHSQDMRSLGVELGRRLGLSPARLAIFEQAAMLHDIGTIHLPNDLLRKKGELSDDEWRQIRSHTTIGEGIIDMLITSERKDLVDLKNIVAQHHEAIDGSGYPRGLKESQIMLEAKILAVTDAYSAMLSNRPYREAMNKFTALDELEQLSGSRFCSKVVDELVALEMSRDNEIEIPLSR